MSAWCLGPGHCAQFVDEVARRGITAAAHRELPEEAAQPLVHPVRANQVLQREHHERALL